MAVNLSPVGGVASQFFDNNGNPLAGGKIFTYAAGTTTDQATYTSASGAIAHSNPIILDGAGRVPSGEIWLTDGLEYKFVIKDSVDALIGTFDNIIGINSNFVNFTNQQEIQTATAGQTVFNLTTMQYAPATNSLSVFVDGVNQYGPGAMYAYVETDSTTVTFTTGLHVGAEVKFTTSQLNSSAGGNAFSVGYVPPFSNSVATNVGDKLAQTVSIKDFGGVCDGVTNDAAALIFALNTANRVLIPPNAYISLTSTQAATVVAALDRIAPAVPTDINIQAGVVSMTTAVNVYNPDALNIRLIGATIASTGVTAVSSVGGGAKNNSIQYTLVSAANVSIGDYIIIAGSTGTGNYKVVEGCFKVTNVSGNNVTVKHTMNAAWPSADFTFASATCYPIKTILKWPINSAGLRIAGCALAQLSNMVLAGSFDISTTPAADSAGDGLQVGSAPDTFNTGLNESEQINAGAVWASRVGLVEWQGNGLQVSGGNFYGTLVSACSNGWRGFQAARAGSVEVKFSSAVGNGASGYQAEAQGWMNADASVANGNQQQGYFVIGGGTVLVGRGHALYNQTGIDARNYGVALGDQAFVRNNSTRGVYSISGFILFGAGASTANNPTFDTDIGEGGILNANGGSSIGVYRLDTNSGAQIIDTDGESIFPKETFLENSDGEKVRWSITSIADLILGFDASGTGVFTNRLTFKADGVLFPNVDGGPTLGRAANRWDTVYAVTPTINTSDANAKQQIRNLTHAEKAVALKVKTGVKAFKFNDAVQKKGSGARVHFGVIAQEVKAAFESEGLDANDYGLFCADKLPDGTTRLGVRYEELLAFIIASI